MKHSLTLLGASLAAAIVASSAMAAGHEISGKIERINAKEHSLTVNHRSYRYGPAMESATFKAGDTVHFSWKKEHHHRMIEKFLPLAT